MTIIDMCLKHKCWSKDAISKDAFCHGCDKFSDICRYYRWCSTSNKRCEELQTKCLAKFWCFTQS